MRKSIAATMTCLLLSGIVLAGCGGGGEGTGAGSGEGESRSGAEPGRGGESGGAEATPKSKAEFAARANAVCEKLRKQMQTDVRVIFEESRSKGFQQATYREVAEDAVAPRLEAEADELRVLQPPQGDAAQVEAIVAAIKAAVGEAHENPRAFVTAGAGLARSQKLAVRYGIGACGRVS